MNLNVALAMPFQLAKCGFQRNLGLLGVNCLSTPLSSSDSYGLIQTNTLVGGVRYKFSRKIRNKAAKQMEGGINYHGFTYFPRFPDQPDPPIEPTKLFMVKRIRSLSGCPYWEKRWMKHLGLVHSGAIAIVRNAPEMNQRLYKVKHLVEITPITTPHGMPDKPENGFLKENGEFVSYNLIEQNGNMSLKDSKSFWEDYQKKHLDKGTSTRRMRQMWYSRFDIVY